MSARRTLAIRVRAIILQAARSGLVCTSQAGAACHACWWIRSDERACAVQVRARGARRSARLTVEVADTAARTGQVLSTAAQREARHAHAVGTAAARRHFVLSLPARRAELADCIGFG